MFWWLKNKKIKITDFNYLTSDIKLFTFIQNEHFAGKRAQRDITIGKLKGKIVFTHQFDNIFPLNMDTLDYNYYIYEIKPARNPYWVKNSDDRNETVYIEDSDSFISNGQCRFKLISYTHTVTVSIKNSNEDLIEQS